MGRPIRAELASADREARRYVRSQLAEARRLGYPPQAAFAKDMARGTISLAPTPEDPHLEFVGRYLWTVKEIERRVVASHYGDDHDIGVKARRLSMSKDRFRRMLDRVLIGLSGYLLDR